MPFYDMDTEIMFLAGKGDGNIRYYEVDFDSGVVVNYISDYTSSTPTAGMAMLAKRGVNVSVNEIVKLYKVTPDSVQPLSFRVPRKSDAFADDIFVDCSSDEPGLGTDAWIGGQNSNPKTISLAGGYVEKPKQSSNPTFTKSETSSETEPSGAALLQAYREQKQRIAYLESELKKLKQ